MNAYLIDPFAQTVNPVEYDGNYESIYGFIEAHAFDVATFSEEHDGVFVDDEGLINGQEQKFFSIRGYRNPLAGKGLVLGCDIETGDSRAPTVTLEEMRDMVTFVFPLRMSNGNIGFLPLGKHLEAEA